LHGTSRFSFFLAVTGFAVIAAATAGGALYLAARFVF